MSGMEKKVVFCLLFFMAGLCLGGTSFSQEPGRVIVADVQGNVQVKVGDSWQPLRVGMVLHEKDQLQTDRDGNTVLFLDKKGKAGRFLLQENSFLTLGILSTGPGPNDRTTRLDLAIGQILAHSEKLTDDSSFEVKTTTATTGVRGTIFFVGVSPQGDTSAGVLQGVIGVRERQTRAEVLVKERQETFVKPGRVAEVKSISPGKLDDMTLRAAKLFNVEPTKPSGPTSSLPPLPSGSEGQGGVAGFGPGGYSPPEQPLPSPPGGYSLPEQPLPPPPGGYSPPEQPLPPPPEQPPPPPPSPDPGRTSSP